MTTTTGRPGAPPVPRPSLLGRLGSAARSSEEGVWRWSGRVAVVLPLAALVFALTVLVLKAWPAVIVNGWNFLTGSQWTYGSSYGATQVTHGVAHPQGAAFGAWPLILGTIQTSVIAVVLALPISVGAAFALAGRVPGWVARPLGLAVEVLAGIPSVILGLWGILTFGPWMATHIYPAMANVAGHLPNVPVLNWFRSPVGHGEGLLSGSLVLTLMIVPIITATTRDLFGQVPPLPKEGGEALGMTDWEVARRVTLPWVRAGIVGATVLGLGRALGETIAIAMITGSVIRVAPNVYSPMTTIAATILSQLDGALTDGTGFAVATLAEAALVLAVISVAVNLAARGIVHRSARLGGAVGR